MYHSSECYHMLQLSRIVFQRENISTTLYIEHPIRDTITGKRLTFFHSLNHSILIAIITYFQQAASTLQKLFVYGTLKAGEANHNILQSSTNGVAKYWCKATTTKKMPLVIVSADVLIY